MTIRQSFCLASTWKAGTHWAALESPTTAIVVLASAAPYVAGGRLVGVTSTWQPSAYSSGTSLVACSGSGVIPPETSLTGLPAGSRVGAELSAAAPWAEPGGSVLTVAETATISASPAATPTSVALTPRLSATRGCVLISLELRSGFSTRWKVRYAGTIVNTMIARPASSEIEPKCSRATISSGQCQR